MQPKRFSTNELFLLPNNFIDFADLSGSMGLGPCREKGSTSDLCGCSLKLFPTEMEEPTMSVATLIDVKGGPKAFWLIHSKLTHLHWVHFLNVFLILTGPEGLGRKNFKI